MQHNKKKILILPGDGIGKEVILEAVKLLTYIIHKKINISIEYADIGLEAIKKSGSSLPHETLQKALTADAILLGAVGGGMDVTHGAERPEQGLLQLRAKLDVFANIRPVTSFPALLDRSALKQEIIKNSDFIFVRELTGGIYYGLPRELSTNSDGRYAVNTMRYNERQISRIAHFAFRLAEKRRGQICLVDKANVLEVSQLWRTIVNEISKKYPSVTVIHYLVDTANLEILRNPKQFDVILTSNLFGDILSDNAALFSGSIGMLASASLNEQGKGIYEPVHGSAPDIAGKEIANPIGAILSLALLFQHSLGETEIAKTIKNTVESVLDEGVHTIDIANKNSRVVSTMEMGDAILKKFMTLQ